MVTTAIRTLFVDVGGVLLTPGWDRAARTRAAKTFRLDAEEFEERHRLTFDVYEQGAIDLAGYLDRVVFHQARSFERETFRQFMLAQSSPHPATIELIRDLRERHGLRVAVVSNEGRELAEHRIHSFRLGGFVDFFVVSGFVGCRKPDPRFYRLALDIAQAPADHVAYIEDRAMFVEVASGLGLHAIHHVAADSTRDALAELGLGDGA